jgi:hypothetical protein
MGSPERVVKLGSVAGVVGFALTAMALQSYPSR